MKPRSLNRIYFPVKGLPMLVMRPDKPELAVALAETAAKNQDRSLFAKIPEIVSGYTFIGYLAEGGRKILDAECNVIGEPQPGDSFVTNSEHKLP